MRLPDEPKRWRKLQIQAQRGRDPRRLKELIEQMNRLLEEREKAAASGGELELQPLTGGDSEYN